MVRTPRLNPLMRIQTTKGKERFEGFKGEDDHDQQPMSPMSRLFHEPGANLYIIVIVGMKTPINLDVLKPDLDRAIKKNYRFSCLQVIDKENGSMTWVPTNVDINKHVVVPELDPNMESSDKFVEDYISNLSRSPMDYSKPVWDLHILNVKTSDAQATCVFHLHHSLGDGLSLMGSFLSCSRKTSDPEVFPIVPGNKVSHHHIKVTSFRSLFTFVWNSLVAVVLFILTALFLRDTETPVKGSLGTEDRPRRFVLKSVSLDDIKMVKNAMNVTVNDVVLGVTQAGLHRYLKRRYGENHNKFPKNIRLRASFAFNLRPSSLVDTKQRKWGNEISFVLLPLYIKHKNNPLDHVWEAKASMERIKASLEPSFASLAAKFLIKHFGMKVAAKVIHRFYSSTTLGFSNVRGPPEEISFCGHEVAYLAPSCYGQPMGLTIHVASYHDKMTFVVSADEETIPDPQNLCDDFQQSLSLIKNSILG